jgi:hypothetical protein
MSNLPARTPWSERDERDTSAADVPGPPPPHAARHHDATTTLAANVFRHSVPWFVGPKSAFSAVGRATSNGIERGSPRAQCDERF